MRSSRASSGVESLALNRDWPHTLLDDGSDLVIGTNTCVHQLDSETFEYKRCLTKTSQRIAVDKHTGELFVDASNDICVYDRTWKRKARLSRLLPAGLWGNKVAYYSRRKELFALYDLGCTLRLFSTEDGSQRKINIDPRASMFELCAVTGELFVASRSSKLIQVSSQIPVWADLGCSGVRCRDWPSASLVRSSCGPERFRNERCRSARSHRGGRSWPSCVVVGVARRRGAGQVRDERWTFRCAACGVCAWSCFRVGTLASTDLCD